MPINKEARNRLGAAKLGAMGNWPYLACAIHSLRPVETKLIPTCGIDQGFRMYYNPKWLMEANLIYLGTMIGHEIYHLIRLHPERIEGRLPGRWHAACDIEINDDIPQMEGLSLPDGEGGMTFQPLTPKTFGLWEKQTAEFYYDKLPPEIDFEGMYLPGGSAAGGPPKPWEQQKGLPKPVDSNTLQNIRHQVAKNANQWRAERAGTLPYGMERLIEDIYGRPKNWRQILKPALRRKLEKARGKDRHCYSKRSRRQIPGVITPGKVGFKPSIAIVLDTSGSMDDNDIAKSLVEIGGICMLVAGDGGVWAASADAKTYGFKRIRKASELKVVGGGGTDMTSAIIEADQLRPRPGVIVVATDGYTDWPVEGQVHSQVVACITKNGEESAPSWIRQVRMSDE